MGPPCSIRRVELFSIVASFLFLKADRFLVASVQVCAAGEPCEFTAASASFSSWRRRHFRRKNGRIALRRLPAAREKNPNRVHTSNANWGRQGLRWPASAQR